MNEEYLLKLTKNQLYKLQLLMGHTSDRDLLPLHEQVKDLVDDDDWDKIRYIFEMSDNALYILDMLLPNIEE